MRCSGAQWYSGLTVFEISYTALGGRRPLSPSFIDPFLDRPVIGDNSPAPYLHNLISITTGLSMSPIAVRGLSGVHHVTFPILEKLFTFSEHVLRLDSFPFVWVSFSIRTRPADTCCASPSLSIFPYQ